MSQTRRIPFRGSFTLGRGFNTLTGEALGKPLDTVRLERATSGQEVIYSVEISETYDALMSNMGLSIEATGRYGLFSAEGKFSLAEKSAFNTRSTYVVASCRVQNAFEMVDEYRLRSEAERLLSDPARWKTTFGTSFIRGLQSGGEFLAIFQVTSTSQEIQQDLAAGFKAGCQGLTAGAEFEASYQNAQKNTSQTTQTSVWMYQRAGHDEQLGYVTDPIGIIDRLKNFPTIARANPAGYEVEVANYDTLALPDVNDEEVADREASLSDCARLRLKFMTRRNEIEFARENRIYFVELPEDYELSNAWENYSRGIAAVQLHAQKIAGRRIPPTIFDPSQLDPPLSLPVVNFKRVDFPQDIPVPDVVGLLADDAKGQIRRLGLNHESDYIYIDSEADKSTGTVTSQLPGPGTMLQPGGVVRLTQRAERFDIGRASYLKYVGPPTTTVREMQRRMRRGG